MPVFSNYADWYPSPGSSGTNLPKLKITTKTRPTQVSNQADWYPSPSNSGTNLLKFKITQVLGQRNLPNTNNMLNSTYVFQLQLHCDHYRDQSHYAICIMKVQMPFSIQMYIFQQIFPKHKKLDKFILYNSMSKLDTNQSNLGKG